MTHDSVTIHTKNRQDLQEDSAVTQKEQEMT